MDQEGSRSAEVNRSATILAAMGDPIRLTILMCVAAEELRVKDLCDIFGCSQANVSGHLKRLVAAGLVSGRRNGRETHYRVADPRIQMVVTTVTAMARAPADTHPEETLARPQTPLLDLLRDGGHAITSLQKALDAVDLRRKRHTTSAQRAERD